MLDFLDEVFCVQEGHWAAKHPGYDGVGWYFFGNGGMQGPFDTKQEASECQAFYEDSGHSYMHPDGSGE